MKQIRSIYLVLSAIAIVIVGIAIFLCFSLETRKRPDMNKQILAIIAELLVKYRATHGYFPQGNDKEISAQIIAEFNGGLPPMIQEHCINRDGFLTDHLGNIVHFETSEKLGIYLNTAGKDQVFGTKDDYKYYEYIESRPSFTSNELAGRWDEEMTNK